MAKKSKKKSSNLSMIVSLICLVLSILMVVSFFIPTYTVGEDKIAVNGVTLTQASFMSEEKAEDVALEIITGDTEKDRENAYALSKAYTYAHDEENVSFKLSAFANLAVLIAGIAGIVFSVLALLAKKINLGLIVSTGVSMLFAILLVIFACSAVNHIVDSAGLFSDFVTTATAAGIWIALVSSILATGSAVVGKVLKK